MANQYNAIPPVCDDGSSMANTAEEIFSRLVNTDETEKIEAKHGTAAGTSILETVCSFSNEPGLGGGYILLGVVRDESGLFPSYEVVGVPNPDQVCADLVTQCATQFNVPVRINIATEHLAGKVCLLVSVAEAGAADKPIFFKARGLPSGALRRSGSVDLRCTEDDIAVLFGGRNGETYDFMPLHGASMDDLDPEAIEDYRRSRSEVSRDAEELRWSDEDLLLALGAVRREGDNAVPTVAGVLLFGTTLALRRLFPMTRVDYIRVPGKEWVPDPAARFETVDMRGSMFSLIRRAQAAILDDLPKAFNLADGELQRAETVPLPQRVIREAVVNALMHRNYRVHSPLQIIRYTNRIEIRNPGFSLKSPDHLGEPGSMARNPRIAAVLHETRFAETKGSGIRVMRETMVDAGLTPPTFESDRVSDNFTARYLLHHFLGAEDVAWLSQFKGQISSDSEARALVWVREVGAIDNTAYRTLNDVETLAASTALRNLRDAGLLEQKGKGAATYYVPTNRLLGETRGVVDKGGEVTKPPMERVEPPMKPPMEVVEPPKVDAGESTRGSGTLDPRIKDLLATVPPRLREMITQGGRRHNPALMRALVLQLCEDQAWRTEDLAAVLGRNREYLLKEFIRPLVDEGLLEHTIPQMPRHPDQAYRATK